MNPPDPIHGGSGIRRKIALYSWSITFCTLLLFLAVIIPAQHQMLRDHLEITARGMVVSMREITAGAVINDDYSTVVDHCSMVLSNDTAMSYVVMTRNDGLSIVCERSSWRQEKLGVEWHPPQRVTSARIANIPLFGRRVFQYSQPLDHLGIEWGWIHVGLSLDRFDQSVAAMYRRTGLLALGCILVSLVASVAYARQFVRPIHSLESSVHKVAQGDLSARAEISSGDEIERLAKSFNQMTGALRRRDKILESVRYAARELLSKEDWKHAIQEVLARLGQAAETGRAYIFENHQDTAGTELWSHRFEWAAPGVAPQIDDPTMQNLPWKELSTEEWGRELNERRIVTAHARQLSARMQQLLGPTIQSLILIPIIVQDQWWGFLGFDQCDREREWSEGEKDSFRAACDMIGAAIERQRTRDALLEANENLEQRVEARTRQLREQVRAKENALAQLAETQQLLMDVSRKSGMAEVATGVLHNVGNVLNSVNVSANLVTERIRRSRLGGVSKIAALLREHQENLAAFLTQDPRGKQVTEYLETLGTHLDDQQSQLAEELRQLVQNVEHIKQIVAMQQSYARVAGVIETLPIAGVVEDALRITESGMVRQGIHVVRDFHSVPPVSLDKHKTLQILVNLLRNARQAVEADSKPDKFIHIRIHNGVVGRAFIQVQDNGVGIASANFTRIFSHGFTTKKNGHGFGLHLSALAAKEMGGTLRVESAGPGLGACFTLELPAVPEAPRTPT